MAQKSYQRQCINISKSVIFTVPDLRVEEILIRIFYRNPDVCRSNQLTHRQPEIS